MVHYTFILEVRSTSCKSSLPGTLLYLALYSTWHFMLPGTLLYLALQAILHSTLPGTIHCLPLYVTWHSMLPGTILYLALHATLHYTQPGTILYLALYVTCHSTVPGTRPRDLHTCRPPPGRHRRSPCLAPETLELVQLFLVSSSFLCNITDKAKGKTPSMELSPIPH